MANDKSFKIKNGLLAGRYLQSNGVETAGSVATDDTANWSNTGNSFTISSQETAPYGVSFNNDGTKMYVIGETSDSVFQYTLSTAYDVSTASYDSVSFSVNSQEVSPRDIVFNNDGTKMYITGHDSDSVYQHSLSTAYDVSTALYDSVSFSVSGQSGITSGLDFNNDGTKMYICDRSSQAVYEYALSTAFNISTASYSSVSLSISSQDTQPNSAKFNSDGTKLFVVGSGNDLIYTYSLTTAYDLSSASYTKSLDITGLGVLPTAISLASNYKNAYIIEYVSGKVYQYSTALSSQTLDLSTGNYFSFTPSGATTVSFTNAPASGKAVGFAVEINGDGSAITWPTSVKWPSGTAPTATASKEVYAFVTTDGGTSYYGKRAGSDIA